MVGDGRRANHSLGSPRLRILVSESRRPFDTYYYSLRHPRLSCHLHKSMTHRLYHIPIVSFTWFKSADLSAPYSVSWRNDRCVPAPAYSVTEDLDDRWRPQPLNMHFKEIDRPRQKSWSEESDQVALKDLASVDSSQKRCLAFELGHVPATPK